MPVLLLLLQVAPSSAAPTTATTTSARAARAAADAVFNAREFDRSLRASLWERFWRVVFGLFRDASEVLGASPPLRWAAVTLLGLVALALLARIAWLVFTSRGAASRTRGRGARAGSRDDAREPWALAQEMAARGDYTDAAHALYRALLETIARRERVRLHPSKTVGDYVRDLRGRSSLLFGRFRDFARSYETIVYGIGSCDRERYERLHALALPIVMGDAAGDAGAAARSRR